MITTNKIKVGERYRTREGQVVTIKHYDDSSDTCSFSDDKEILYTVFGHGDSIGLSNRLGGYKNSYDFVEGPLKSASKKPSGQRYEWVPQTERITSYLDNHDERWLGDVLKDYDRRYRALAFKDGQASCTYLGVFSSEARAKRAVAKFWCVDDPA